MWGCLQLTHCFSKQMNDNGRQGIWMVDTGHCPVDRLELDKNIFYWAIVGMEYCCDYIAYCIFDCFFLWFVSWNKRSKFVCRHEKYISGHLQHPFCAFNSAILVRGIRGKGPRARRGRRPCQVVVWEEDGSALVASRGRDSLGPPTIERGVARSWQRLPEPPSTTSSDLGRPHLCLRLHLLDALFRWVVRQNTCFCVFWGEIWFLLLFF